MSLILSFICAGLHWSIPVENLRPLLEELKKDIEIWISQEKPVYADSWKPQKAPIYLEPVYTEASQSKYVECSWKSYPFAEYFKKKKIDPKFDSRYSKFYTNQRHTIAGSYVWAETDLSDFADELEKPLHSGKLSWLDVLINCQYKIENSPQVVGLTGEVYNNCEVLIRLSASIFKRAWCLLEAANYTTNGCKIYVVGECSFLQGEDYFSAMKAGVVSDEGLIRGEIIKKFGADYHAKFNRTIDDAIVQVYGESLLYHGRFQEAEPLLRKELEIKRGRGDENSIASTYLQLGRALYSLGNYAESLSNFGEALQRFVRCFGTGHVSVAGTNVNIGEMYRHLGDYEKALLHYNLALPVFISQLGGAHVSVADTKNNIAAVLEQQGKFDEALKLYQEALETTILAVGPSHVSVAATEKNIGNVLSQKGDYENALLRYQKALDIEIKSLGGAHVSGATTYVNMGSCVLTMGRYEEARDYYQNALEIFQKSLGNNHPSTLAAKSGLALVFGKLGEYENELKLYEEVLETQVRCLGTGHVSVADTKNNMAIVYGNLGNQAKRLQLNREVHAIYMQALGPDHPKTKGIAAFI